MVSLSKANNNGLDGTALSGPRGTWIITGNTLVHLCGRELGKRRRISRRLNRLGVQVEVGRERALLPVHHAHLDRHERRFTYVVAERLACEWRHL